MLKAVACKNNLEDSAEFYSYIEDLLETEPVKMMMDFPHHGHSSCFQHCLNVSYSNYRICKFFHLDAKSGARAGLLHDLFLYDWHKYVAVRGQRLHGFTHAALALRNAEIHYELNDLERDIIKKHMFPLNVSAIPKYKETAVIVFTDKYCGALEVLAHNFRFVPKFVNLFRKKEIA
ncbi:MAG: phosphohydrolase [Ruminococcus sp.]|jgi:uncharacterized protein|nr:phosphohydrolase [Ruminococcus sp.]